MSETSFDAVVLGAGPGGRGAARRLAKAGMRVAMVESELVGGECPFWACIPTKALLRPIEASSEAAHVAGLGEPPRQWQEIAAYRDYMNSGLDDRDKARGFALMGVKIVRGHGRIAGPGRVEVDGQELEAGRIVVATGTDSAVPPIDGLEGVDYWTNREATTFTEVPGSVIVLGGGPVGLELGQIFSRYGAEVTIVEAADRLLPREAPAVGEQLLESLTEEGITVRLGLSADAVEQTDGGVSVRLAGGEQLAAERLVLAAGRTPRVGGIGLDSVGIEPGKAGIEVDEHCRAAEGVWAVGDVTGVSPFTHVAAYQAAIACADILGDDPRPADYRAIPRVVFTWPEAAAVGLTPDQAEERGLETTVATADLARVDRTETYGQGLGGVLGVLADTRREVLVGAWAVGPLASEWIHTLVLAIKAEVPVRVLRDTVMQFPSFSEAIVTAVRRLEL